MDARFKKLISLEKEPIKKELYDEYSKDEPRNIMAETINPVLDKYVNPKLEKFVESVNKISPVQLSENINIPKISKGETEEMLRDMPQNLAGGFSGGITNKVPSKYQQEFYKKLIDYVKDPEIKYDLLKKQQEVAENLNNHAMTDFYENAAREVKGDMNKTAAALERANSGILSTKKQIDELTTPTVFNKKPKTEMDLQLDLLEAETRRVKGGQ